MTRTAIIQFGFALFAGGVLGGLFAGGDGAGTEKGPGWLPGPPPPTGSSKPGTLDYRTFANSSEFVRLIGEGDVGARIDPESLVRSCLETKATPYNEGAKLVNEVLFPMALKEWISRDPVAAFSYLQDFDDRMLASNALADGLTYWAAGATEEELEAIEEAFTGDGGNPMMEVGVKSAAVIATADRDPQTAWQLCRRFQLQNLMAGRVFSRIAEADPAAATALFEGIEEPNLRRMAAAGLVSGLAKSDPDAAMELIESEDGLDRSELMNIAIGELSILVPERASTIVSGLSDAEKRELAPTLVENWAGASFDDALNWIDREIEGEQRQALIDSAFNGAMGQGGADFANLAEKGNFLSIGPQRNQALRRVLLIWGGRDPESALAWLGRQDLDDAIRGGYEEAFSEWLRTDPDGAFVKRNLYTGEAGKIFDSVVESGRVPYLDTALENRE